MSVVVRRGVRVGVVSFIALHGAIDESRQMSCLVCRVIDQEFEPRCMPQAQATTNFTAQKPTRARQPLAHLLGGIFRGKWREEHAGDAHIGRETHGRYGDVSHARVLHLARDQLREHALDLRFDPACARFRH